MPPRFGKCRRPSTQTAPVRELTKIVQFDKLASIAGSDREHPFVTFHSRLVHAATADDVFSQVARCDGRRFHLIDTVEQADGVNLHAHPGGHLIEPWGAARAHSRRHTAPGRTGLTVAGRGRSPEPARWFSGSLRSIVEIDRATSPGRSKLQPHERAATWQAHDALMTNQVAAMHPGTRGRARDASAEVDDIVGALASPGPPTTTARPGESSLISIQRPIKIVDAAAHDGHFGAGA